MPNLYPVDAFLFFSGTVSGGELRWSSFNVEVRDFDVVDANEDGNWDVATDYFAFTLNPFTGFLWEAPDGTRYPIFRNDFNGNYFIPYDTVVADLATVFPNNGATTIYEDNAVAFPLCFAPGTLIATDAGEAAVEALAIGDLVLTADGRAVPVKWLGRQTLAPMFQRVRLVRVTAGALGAGLPLRDLTVTADHALVIDGLLVNAGALVNGTTISEVRDRPERVTVYHIETEAHEVILAEGTPAETYIDYAGRRVFDNYAEYVALYGEERGIVENPAPRVTCARMLPPALKARLGISRAA